MTKKEDSDEIKKQLKLVNAMATWMPWVAVVLSIIATSALILFALGSVTE